jgi:outer membrane protein assembly factor BamA
MTKFNFFSLLILTLFYNTNNIFSQNQTNTIDIKKYDYLISENYKIKKIEIIGNKRTKKDIILRELSVKENDLMDKNTILKIVEEDRRKLINTNLFNEVDIMI